jgi:hypothetical protein
MRPSRTNGMVIGSRNHNIHIYIYIYIYIHVYTTCTQKALPGENPPRDKDASQNLSELSVTTRNDHFDAQNSNGNVWNVCWFLQRCIHMKEKHVGMGQN